MGPEQAEQPPLRWLEEDPNDPGPTGVALDDAAWVEAINEARRRDFAELADL